VMGEREKGFPIVPGLYCPLMLKMSCLAFKVATEQCIYHVSIKFVVPDSHWTGIFSLARHAVCLGLSLVSHSHSMIGACNILQAPHSPRIPHCFPPPSCCCRDCCWCASRLIFCFHALASYSTFDAPHVNKLKWAQKKETWEPHCKHLPLAAPISTHLRSQDRSRKASERLTAFILAARIEDRVYLAARHESA
jgi:hypothetical protein